MKRRKPPRRTTTSGHAGRPGPGDSFQDANLRARLRMIADELGRAVTSDAVWRVALQRNAFTASQLAVFGRRAAIQYIDGALSAINPETGADDRISVREAGPGPDAQQLWIKEPQATAQEYTGNFHERAKQISGDVSALRRLWERAVARHGPDAIPPWDQLGLPL